ncbi:MAG: VWA domain-containing protein [Phycisphaera sp.]|nr:VWA domain-containing protein [Phycisphaera sp.]
MGRDPLTRRSRAMSHHTPIRILSLMILLVTLSGVAALADGLIIIRDPVPVPRNHYAFAPLQIVNHNVKVTITDQVAVTEVDQTFYNPNNQRLEGTYLFPIPKGANIDKFTMDINGKQIEAELLDADKARQIYTDIVRHMRDPALLEYAGQGAFKVRIFPIEPNSNKRVTLKYTQLLTSDSGLTEYVYPLNTEKFSAAPIKSVSVQCEIRTTDPLKTIYSPSHKVETVNHGPTKAVVGFETTNARPDSDFHLVFSTQPPDGKDIAVNLMAYNDADGDGYFLMLASPGSHLASEKIAKKDVVFVVDTSGSMAGEKLDQAKKAMRFCIANLDDGDRFDVVRFSTEAEPLFDGLTEASEANRKKATEFVDGFKPIGGTAIEDALTQALRSRKDRDPARPFVVIFLTDGRPTIGNVDEDGILKSVATAAGDDTARVFSFGIGTDINTHLLDRLTEKTRAFSEYVLPDEDIEVKVSNFYTKIAHPVLSDLHLSFSGGVRVTKLHPPVLGDLFMGQQLVAFGRYSGHGDAAIILEGNMAGKEVKLVNEVRFPKKAREHEFIPRLWATRRVGFLLDQIRLHGESGELKDEVTQLARRYHIVTPYTSYLIVEDESRRDVPVASRTIQFQGGAGGREREELSNVARRLNSEKSGDLAVAGAKESQQLRQADSLDEADAAKRVYRAEGLNLPAAATAPTAGPVDDAAAEGQSAAREARFVEGRTFYLQGDEWIDGMVQSKPNAKRIEITFGSDEYFELLDKHPEAAKWLSVGQHVQVLIDTVVYVIK